jgi:chitinase
VVAAWFRCENALLGAETCARSQRSRQYNGLELGMAMSRSVRIACLLISLGGCAGGSGSPVPDASPVGMPQPGMSPSGGPTGADGQDPTNGVGQPGDGGSDGGHQDGGGGGGSPGSARTEFAPYFYAYDWHNGSYGFSSLVDMRQKKGPSEVTLAFVLSDGGCKVTRDVQNNIDDVKRYIAAGGHVRASFGGQAGTYLEYRCASAPELASAISAFVDETGITDLDFDLEQGTRSSQQRLNALRAAALKQVQDRDKITVSLTLPVDDKGLDDLGLAIVKAMVAAGVKISYVNGMTMDYGDEFAKEDMGDLAISSLQGIAKQLRSIIPGLSLDAAYHMIGATAMIGHNDDKEIFTMDHARKLIDFAKQHRLGFVSFWAIQRDQRCAGKLNVDFCTGVNDGPFQFTKIFSSVNG